VSGSGGPIEVRSFSALIQDGRAPGKSSDKQEKVVTIVAGTAFLSNDTMSKLLNDKFRKRKDISVSNDNGKVKITGKAKKTITIPFTIEGPVSLTQQGFIQLKTETVKAGKLPGLAELLGMNPEKMTGDGSVKGVRADKNSISFDPDLLWGLPVHGKVTKLALERNGLLLVFGPQRAAKKRH
jgi:hypothetical protein